MPISTQMDFSGKHDAEGKFSKALAFVGQHHVLATIASLTFQATALEVTQPMSLAQEVGARLFLGGMALFVGFTTEALARFYKKYADYSFEKDARIETQPNKGTLNTQTTKAWASEERKFYRTLGACFGIASVTGCVALNLSSGPAFSLLAIPLVSAGAIVHRMKKIEKDEWIVQKRTPPRKKKARAPAKKLRDLKPQTVLIPK